MLGQKVDTSFAQVEWRIYNDSSDDRSSLSKSTESTKC